MTLPPTASHSRQANEHRTLDPLFALLIGGTAAWSRIRREELSRFALQHSSGSLDSSSISLSPANAYSNASSSSAGGAEADTPTPPTARDTLDALQRRVRKVQFDPRKWDFEWRDLWRKRERWGIVDPNG